jgi:hypothetical protein
VLKSKSPGWSGKEFIEFSSLLAREIKSGKTCVLLEFVELTFPVILKLVVGVDELIAGGEFEGCPGHNSPVEKMLVVRSYHIAKEGGSIVQLWSTVRYRM